MFQCRSLNSYANIISIYFPRNNCSQMTKKMPETKLLTFPFPLFINLIVRRCIRFQKILQWRLEAVGYSVHDWMAEFG